MDLLLRVDLFLRVGLFLRVSYSQEIRVYLCLGQFCLAMCVVLTPISY